MQFNPDFNYYWYLGFFFVFFFQAEDGIRDSSVTGVQTCALPISETLAWIERLAPRRAILTNLHTDLDYDELRSRLPPGAEPAYDGLRIEFSAAARDRKSVV